MKHDQTLRSWQVLTIVDRCLGLVLFCTWLLANAYVMSSESQIADGGVGGPEVSSNMVWCTSDQLCLECHPVCLRCANFRIFSSHHTSRSQPPDFHKVALFGIAPKETRSKNLQRHIGSFLLPKQCSTKLAVRSQWSGHFSHEHASAGCLRSDLMDSGVLDSDHHLQVLPEAKVGIRAPIGMHH